MRQSLKKKLVLLENFQELKNKLKALQKELKELNELLDYQNEERNNLQRENAQTHKDYEDLEKSKYNLWVECEELKRSMQVLNEKLLKNEEFKG